MNTQVSNVTGYSSYKMVCHCEQYLGIMFTMKVMVDQIVIEKKIYEQNIQGVSVIRKYPNGETFAVGKLVLVYHLLRSV